ncbi:mannitol dehydrogenase family protein [Vibrio artabrorum]|uniref:mannitol dehydrogenase family protein n=1 Tax=Vibrio artabrorum TaxID=446374 RepID=UPI0021C350E8|nr:fructuronate reductase [Vibrio artabrorum]
MNTIRNFAALTSHAEQNDIQLQLPKYDRSKLETKIVHFGFGAFHRAHQALILDELLNRQGSSQSLWGICEVNLLGNNELIEQLRTQDHLFSVLEKSPDGDTVKVIGSVKESLTLSLDGYQAILNKLCEPQISIVSMTVTEKGYCIDAATGKLDLSHPVIQADLATPEQPTSMLGFLVIALKLRKDSGLAPFSIMSCDNIQENGHITRQAVLDLATAQDPVLAVWIDENVTFPNTMVDRIVPAITQQSLDDITHSLGLNDSVGIACEPFFQWVIEDNFVNGRPDWDKTGNDKICAQFVGDVLPFETMKLRMLNGSHSFLAYLGYLSGYKTIYETMQDSRFKQAALNLMLDEQKPTLSVPASFDLQGYALSLVNRYSNHKIEHKTWQIAMDGSQKLPQRALKSIEELIQNNKNYRYLALLVAGWIRYVRGEDEDNQPIDVQDPLAKELKALATEHSSLTGLDLVNRYLNVSQIFSQSLTNNKAFQIEVSSFYQALCEKGAKKTVHDLVNL